MTLLPPKYRAPISASGPHDPESSRSGDPAASYQQTGHSASGGGTHHGQGQDWWSRLSQTQVELLRPWSAQLFEKLDDALFDRSGSSFQQFFVGMRILRKSRDALLQGWFDKLDDGWKSLKPLPPGAFRPRLVSGGAESAAGDLSLVDEMTLERKLAIDSAVARGASLLRMELPALCHRLAVLRNGVPVQTSELPAAPAMLIQTFADSLDDVPDLPVEVAIVVFKLFDRVVMSKIEVICKELNRILVLGGVAPQWNWSPASRRAAAARSTAPANPASVSQGDSWEDPRWLETVPTIEQDVPEQDASSALLDLAAGGNFGASGIDGGQGQARLTATVRALLEHHRMARYAAVLGAATGQQHLSGSMRASFDGAPGWNGGGAESAPQRLELQTLMEVLASLPSPKLPTSWVGDVEEAWDPAMLKNELSRSLNQRMPKAKTKSARAEPPELSLGEHEDVIDMVAMMFGFIQQDQALPPAVQALLSRLQLPYLRLALSDPGMFSDPDHPARALMDRLAEVGKSCTPDSPMLAERMLRMHALVGRIVANHDATRPFFEREWVQFRAWSDAAAQRAAARERDQLSALVEADPKAFTEEAPAAAEAEEKEFAEFESELAESLRELEEDNAPSLVDEVDSGHVDPPVVVVTQETVEQLAQPSERSRLHQIRLYVTDRMHKRLDGRDMPEGLRRILSLLWVNRQIRVCHKYGAKSYEVSSLDRQLDAVVDLLSMKPGVKAQESFEEDWPGIERAWTQVLAEGPASAEARNRWIAMFRRWADVRTGRAEVDSSSEWNWQDGLVADSRPTPPVAADASSSSQTMVTETKQQLPASQSGEATAESASAEQTAKPSAFRIKPILSKPTPTRWTVGDWIEFKEVAGEGAAAADSSAAKSSAPARGKVSWIGAFTGRTILVKPDGTLWREESRTDLDDWIDRGTAFIVPRESLFDRSLQSMFRKLRDGVASALA